jgi:undecaprenyl-diphosphatase
VANSTSSRKQLVRVSTSATQGMPRRLQLIRHHSAAWFRRVTGVVGDLELSVLIAAALVVIGSWVFIVIAGLVAHGGTQVIDERLMQALRRSDDPSIPLGPLWLRDAAIDITALGGGLVLTLVSLAVAGFILLHRRYGALVLLILASSGGALLNALLKSLFARDRPTIVPQLVTAMHKSFPSGHAMSSATIYLALAVLLAGLTVRRRDRAYILGVALTMTFLSGLSRVYLGVHYPSDVLAGWAAGLVWALLCWIAVRSAPRIFERLSRK